MPSVQTKLGGFATDKINKDFNTNITVKKIDLSFLGLVKLKGIEIRDHHNDTLIFVNKAKTSLLSAKSILENQINLGNIVLDDAYFFMKKYKGEEDDNLAVFINLFTKQEKDSLPKKPFILKSSNATVNNLNYRLTNENSDNPLYFSATNASGKLKDLLVSGPNFSAKVRDLNFIDNRGLHITNLTSDYTYTKTAMFFKNTTLQTQKSNLKADVVFKYIREDLADFNNKVNITAKFKKSKLAILDVKKYYSELSGDDIATFTSDFKGTLNNFLLKSLKLESTNSIEVEGDLAFKNSVNTENGFVFTGDLKKAKANYDNLTSILPNVLGTTLPIDLKSFGDVLLTGKIKATTKELIADANLESKIGKIISDLKISNINDIDNASYKGDIELERFKLGAFLKNPLLGILSLKGNVVGSGVKLRKINTSFKGKVSKIGFKEYVYKNIDVNGKYQKNKFDGDLKIDDENFKMDFKGLADLSEKINKFDFNADIDHLNLKETKLFTRDSISKVKGIIDIDVTGSSFNNLIGNAVFKNIEYTNEKENFKFKEFKVLSSVKDDIKRIEVDSKDICKGYLSGKFSFEEVLPVAQNALGSIYTNYKPYKVAPNQFIDFNFTIYNKIVTVFFPKISIDNTTKIKGRVNSNKSLLKLNLDSPLVNIYGNRIKNIKLITNNQNTLYNTSLTADEIYTEYYNVSKLNLLNRTQNDTLFFKSVFKGGLKKNKDFNLDFFYTFDKEGKSVVGFEDSSFTFKDNIWNINPDKANTDKITFDINKGEYNFSQFKIVSGKQKIEFAGSLKGKDEKIFLADFTNVDIQSFLPKIDSLSLKGQLSGTLDFVQKDGLYAPEATLAIQGFEMNNFKQGDLFLSVAGDNSYERYNVDLSIENKKVKNIAATGNLDFSTPKPLIDLEVYLEEFRLDAFSPLGQNVLSSIRGSASGNLNLKGFLGNPEMDGTLILKDAGLKFPYLNVDYDFEGESLITLEQQSFILEDVSLLDTKHKTRGKLQGDITHLNFDKWFLNIEIESDNLLILDTENTEESLYYGTGFIKGNASITGLTDQLTIDVNAKTMPNTKFVVPLKDVETVDTYKLIHFKNDEISDVDRKNEIAKEALKGLSLNIDLEVTKDAIAQVVIDEVNGSQLAGRGKGNLRIEINTRGKFNMYGDYTIDKGIYDFKYGGIVNKPFLIQKGGTVSWNGDPFEANLDVVAVYKAKANPGVLLENFTSNRKIEVDLVTRITGGLFSSKQELDIQLTNVNPTIAGELEFLLNDNNVNEKTTQFISLLAFGNFANPDRTDFDVNIANTASSAISSAFSSLLNSPESKFQLNLDYQQGTRGDDLDRLNIDNQVDVSVSTQLSDRVIINGKVGVPVGTQTQSSVIGEVKIEVLLNKGGNFRGTIFNRQNEIQYSQEEEGYTQGAGLSYQVNFNTIGDLLRKLQLKKQKEKSIETKKVEIKKDTIINNKDGFINFEGN